jgi:hypothetical protein
MKVAISLYTAGNFTDNDSNDDLDVNRIGLVLCFGGKSLLEDSAVFQQVKNRYPSGDILLCSTAGEIYGSTVSDNTITITAIEFEAVTINTSVIAIDEFGDSYQAGKALMNQLGFSGLSYVMVISDGSKVNGSELLRGINDVVQNRVPVTGGLAGDGTAFESTLVGLNAVPSSGKIVAIGFYGDRLVVSHGSMGGWEIFGPERIVTRSTANELFEIEGKNALELYKKYLGPFADELPGSALLFPLAVKLSGVDELVVRTILSVRQETGSMIFAGDIPEGASVRFMKANFDKLIDAATLAARQAFQHNIPKAPKLAILISCVGRKIILGSRTEEEVEAVVDAFGEQTKITGFYSYGEISPFAPQTKCELHNQTMTITTLDEN